MEWVGFDVAGELDTADRYGLLARMRDSGARRGVQLRGFALGSTVQLLLDGPRAEVGRAVAVTKMGTVQAAGYRGRSLTLGPTRRRPVARPASALVALHRGAGCPLANPWTSHRDLLGLRIAPFFDAAQWRIDPRWVHVEAGGRALPVREARERRPLAELLDTAGAVLGVLPADRTCFGLFVHLASRLGWTQKPIASALMVTPRRVRQLKRQPTRGLQAALLSVADERLGPPDRRRDTFGHSAGA